MRIDSLVARSEIKAVIPAAGMGSRMLPLTKSIPKEMLVVGRKPMIQHVVEEAVASGINQICVIIREGKEVIRDYFILPYAGGKHDHSVDELAALAACCELTFIYQPEPLGLGDALLQAKDFVGADPFVMLVPDQLMDSAVPATLQLVRRWGESAGICSSLMRLPKEERGFFAGARGINIEEEINAGSFRLGTLQTEEETRAIYQQRPYEIRGFGRTVYPPEIFDYLGKEFINPQTGEVDLLKTFEKCAGAIEHRGVLLDGEPSDLGTFAGYYHYLPRYWRQDVEYE